MNAVAEVIEALEEPPRSPPGEIPDESNVVDRATLDPTGSRLCITTSDGGLMIVDARTGHLIRSLATQSLVGGDPVWSEDGSWLAIRANQSVTLYDSHTGEIIWKAPAEIAGFSRIAISPDRRWIAAQSVAGGIHLFDGPTGTLKHHIPSSSITYGIAFAKDTSELYVGSPDGSIQVWELSENSPPLLVKALN